MTVASIVKYTKPTSQSLRWAPTSDASTFVSSIPASHERRNELVEWFYDFDDALTDVKTHISRDHSFMWNSTFEGDSTYLVTFWKSFDEFKRFNSMLISTPEYAEFEITRKKITEYLGIEIEYLPLKQLPEKHDALHKLDIGFLLQCENCK